APKRSALPHRLALLALPALGRTWRARARAHSGGLGEPFDGRSIDVHILLTGQLHQGVHQLVGHGPLDERVTGQTVVAREVQRLADADLDAPRPPHARTDRVDLLR